MWEKFKKESLISNLTLILLAALVAFALIHKYAVNSPPSILVAEFQTPASNGSAFSVSGKTVANLISDGMQDLLRDSNDVAMSFNTLNTAGSAIRWPQDQPVAPLFDFGRLSETPDVGVQVGGFSRQRIMAVWHALSQTQRIVNGDVVFDRDRMYLLARIESVGRWQTDSFPATRDGLVSATRELASQILTALSPAVGGV